MITQSKKAKGVVIKVLLTLPLFALLLFANCNSNENYKSSDNKTGAATENVEKTVVSDNSEPIAESAEVIPEYPGGTAAMFEFIQSNVTYPESAKDKGIEGRVYIGFVVEKDGSISNVNVLRGVCEELDAEAVRVVKAMPKWNPGMNHGELVRVQYNLPIYFKLTDNK